MPTGLHFACSSTQTNQTCNGDRDNVTLPSYTPWDTLGSINCRFSREHKAILLSLSLHIVFTSCSTLWGVWQVNQNEVQRCEARRASSSTRWGRFRLQIWQADPTYLRSTLGIDRNFWLGGIIPRMRWRKNVG